MINKNTYFKVLGGFVGTVDWMGDDSAIAQAARVSYGKGTKKTSDDRKLIRYLISHEHLSPIEMCVAKFHLRLPIFTARQLAKHRFVSANEISGRYSELPTDFYEPKLDRYKLQSETNKQGSSDKTIPEEELNTFYLNKNIIVF